MKKYIIRGAEKTETHERIESRRKDVMAEGNDDMQVFDGYHTMDELYDHRIALYIALCKELVDNKYSNVWRSKLHADGTSFDGWFILGINRKKGKQITYHLPIKEWDETAFAQTREKAPEFDGHTPADVIDRLKNI